jgi:hypothetical protein
VEDFSEKITSGSDLLRVTSWTPGQNKWARLCRKANPQLSVRIMGVDKDVSRQDPERKIFSSTVIVSVQK